MDIRSVNRSLTDEESSRRSIMAEMISTEAAKNRQINVQHAAQV
jgi:hypothetical protein